MEIEKSQKYKEKKHNRDHKKGWTKQFWLGGIYTYALCFLEN